MMKEGCRSSNLSVLAQSEEQRPAACIQSIDGSQQRRQAATAWSRNNCPLSTRSSPALHRAVAADNECGRHSDDDIAGCDVVVGEAAVAAAGNSAEAQAAAARMMSELVIVRSATASCTHLHSPLLQAHSVNWVNGGGRSGAQASATADCAAGGNVEAARLRQTSSS